MLTVLLESQARRQRRMGGMTLSVAAHIAIIAAITATTVRGTPLARERIQPIPVTVRPPDARPAERQPKRAIPSAQRSTPRMPLLVPNATIDQLPAATWNEPPLLPSIDFGRGPVEAPIIRTGGSTGARGPRTVVDGEGNPDEDAWRGNELLMRIVVASTPHYPLTLRQAGIDGRVLVRFVVDTTGRIDMASVQVLQSTHDLFTRAVRDALSGFRFRPAEAGQHRVPALAEMPFEFRITR